MSALVTMHVRLDGKLSVQSYEFDKVEDARAFYADRKHSVDDGNTLGVEFQNGEESERYGVVMTDKKPLRYRVLRCNTCYQWHPYFMVWDGMCDFCEDKQAGVPADFEEHVAHFKTKKKAEIFHRTLKNKVSTMSLLRPMESVNQHGEDCWSVFYTTKKSKKRQPEAEAEAA